MRRPDRSKLNDIESQLVKYKLKSKKTALAVFFEEFENQLIF